MRPLRTVRYGTAKPLILTIRSSNGSKRRSDRPSKLSPAKHSSKRIGTLVRLTRVDREIRVAPVSDDEAAARGSPLLRALHDRREPWRREADDHGYPDEPVNDWIDDALAAYRREQDGLGRP